MQESGACLALSVDGLATDAQLTIQLSDLVATPLARYLTDPVHSPIMIEVPASLVDGPLAVQIVRCLHVDAKSQALSALAPLAWPTGAHIQKQVQVHGPSSPMFTLTQVYPLGSLMANTDSRTIAIADVDQDRHLDLLVANTDMSQKNISLLRGTGDGKWAPPEIISSMTSRPRGITVADLNGDGLVDIAAGVEDPMASQPILVSIQQNNKMFGPLNPVAGTQAIQPVSIAAEDFDNDWLKDLAVAYDGDNTIWLYQNMTPMGGSSVQVKALQTMSLLAGMQVSQVSAADLNGDHQPDLIFTRLADTDNFGVAINGGNWNFPPPTTLSLPTRLALFAIADLDGDHSPDLLVTNNNVGGGTSDGHVSILLGKDRPWATASSRVDAQTSFTRAVAVADFDGDQIPDLAVVGYDSNKLRLLLGDGKGAFTLANTSFDIGCPHPLSLVTGDFNEDCRPDLAVACEYGTSVQILMNTTSP
jgi:hypothetical protein